MEPRNSIAVGVSTRSSVGGVDADADNDSQRRCRTLRSRRVGPSGAVEAAAVLNVANRLVAANANAADRGSRRDHAETRTITARASAGIPFIYLAKEYTAVSSTPTQCDDLVFTIK